MKVYCIGWDNDEKTEYIENFFKNYDLKIIKSINGLYDYYSKDVKTMDNIDIITFANHLKILRKFVDSVNKNNNINNNKNNDINNNENNNINNNEKSDICIVCEDYITINGDFDIRLEGILSNLPDNFSLISLIYETESDEIIFGGKNPELQNMIKIPKGNVYGTSMYIINLKWAMNVLEIFDKPWSKLPESQQNVESIIRYSQGYLAYPPLGSYPNSS